MKPDRRANLTIILGLCGTLVTSVASAIDYGDAPGPYLTASHGDTTFQWLGAYVSSETVPRASDTFDDGIAWSPRDVVPGQSFDLTFQATSTYQTEVVVSIWVDWDQDRRWEEPAEQVVDWQGTVYPSGSGYHTFVTRTVAAPGTALLGETWLRARLDWAYSSGASIMSPTSYQTFGECEDYAMAVVPEPATVLLLGIGGLGILARRLRTSSRQ